MPIPISKSYYCLNTVFDATTYGALSETSPIDTNTTWGWNVGRNNPPLYCEMNRGIEVIRTSAQWKATPTASNPSQNAGGSGAGNCWAFGPIKGEFLQSNLQVTMSVKSVTVAAIHTGRFNYRFWKSPNSDGTSATLITSSFIQSSIASIPNNTTTIVPTTSSVLFPNTIFRNDYLFVQTYWQIVTSPGGGTSKNNVDVDFVLGANNSVFKFPSFVANKPPTVLLSSDEI